MRKKRVEEAREKGNLLAFLLFSLAPLLSLLSFRGVSWSGLGLVQKSG